jgi:uncharacterized protein YeaO (DUF488 family)
MVRIGNPYKMQSAPTCNYSEIWNIMRYPVTANISMQLHRELAPSQELYFMFKRLKDMGAWNAKTFRELYVPIYLQEMKDSREARDSLNYLYKRAQDSDICVCCTCYDENLCHRSIVQGLVNEALQATGTIIPNFTSKGYYDMFRSKEPILVTYNSKGVKEQWQE